MFQNIVQRRYKTHSLKAYLNFSYLIKKGLTVDDVMFLDILVTVPQEEDMLNVPGVLSRYENIINLIKPYFDVEKVVTIRDEKV